MSLLYALSRSCATTSHVVPKISVLALCAALMGVMLCASANAAVRFPLKVTANGRALSDQGGQPFLLWGDAAWSIIVQPTLDDALLYLDDRRAKGFDAILVNLIEHNAGVNAPANAQGKPPFSGRPFVTPNEAYFADADKLIQAAAARNLLVLLAPLYLGYDCGAEGWCSEVQSASTDELQSWGRYVGQRYAAFDNILWVIGGDADPTPVADKVRAFVAGVLAVDTRHPMTAHNAPESFALTPWRNETWLSVNNVYSYSTALYSNALSAYQQTPIKSFFLIESNYESEHGLSQQALRAQAYFTMLSGGMGYVFGNCPVWCFGNTPNLCGSAGWKAQLNSEGALAMGRAQRLFASRPWQSLVPDSSHTAVTAGYGTFGDAKYVTAARASDGATVIAYLPTGQSITVNLGSVSGSASRAWWFEPSTGNSTSLGRLATTGARTFTPPSNSDWIFVLDDDSRGFGAPGSAPATPVPGLGDQRLGRLFFLGIALAGLALLARPPASRRQAPGGAGVQAKMRGRPV